MLRSKTGVHKPTHAILEGSPALHCGLVASQKMNLNNSFSKRPVINRRSPRTQRPLTMHDFERMIISSQERARSSQETDMPIGIARSPRSLNSRDSLRNPPNGEQWISKIFPTKEINLTGKLQKAGEKLKPTFQNQKVHSAPNNQYRCGKESQRETGRIQTRQTGAMLSQHERKQSGRSMDKLQRESRLTNLKQCINIQAPKTKQTKRNSAQRSQQGHEKSPQRKDERPNTGYGFEEPEWNVTSSKMTLQGQSQCSERKEAKKGYLPVVQKILEITYNNEKEASINGTNGAKEKNYTDKTHKNEQEIPLMNLKRSFHAQLSANYKTEVQHSEVEERVLQSSQKLEADEILSLPDDDFQLLPCSYCNRTFRSERLETHSQICKKLNHSKRPVYNSSYHRTKGLQKEEFLRTHIRVNSPELFKKIKKLNHYREIALATFKPVA